MSITVEQLYRFPVKGLPGELVDAVDLEPGQGVPHDRRFAIARGDTRFDPSNPRWLPKQWFVMLMRDVELARVTCRFDPVARTITLRGPDGKGCIADFDTVAGRGHLESFVNEALGNRREGRARFVEAGDVSLTDVPQNCLSLINLGSVRDLEARMGVSIHPLRFRANIYVNGSRAWEEFDWVGREITVGQVRLRIPARIPRCAATAVDPDTGRRDVNVVKGLRQAYGHYDMGVYAEVESGGRIAVGDAVEPPHDAASRSWAGHWMRFFGFIARGAPSVLQRSRARRDQARL
jgi:uncharacterized protein YcbX